MANYPDSASGLGYITYPVGPTAAGITVTAHATLTHTKGTYVEVVASLPFACTMMHIFIRATTATAGRLYLVDLSTGADGAESVVVPNIPCEGTSSASGNYGAGLYRIPLAIPAGTRVAVRCQSNVAASTLQFCVTFEAAGNTPAPTAYTNYGADTATSRGIAIDPGVTADTKPATFTEITSSTGAIIQALVPIFTWGHTTVAQCGWAIDLATGASTSEVVLIPDLRVTAAVNAGSQPIMVPRSYDFLTYIAAGTRLSARASCSINTATARLFDMVLLASVAPRQSAYGPADLINGGLIR